MNTPKEELVLKAALSTANKFYQAHSFEVQQAFSSLKDFYLYTQWLASRLHPNASFSNKQIVRFVSTTIRGKLQDCINADIGYRRVRSEKGIQSIVPFAILEEVPEEGAYRPFTDERLDSKELFNFLNGLLDEPIYNPYQKVTFIPRQWYFEFMKAGWISSVVAQNTKRNIKYVSLIKRLMFQELAKKMRERFPEYVDGQPNIKYITPRK